MTKAETRTLDEIPKGTPLKLYQFIEAVNNTKPQRLAELTGVEKAVWYGYRQNSKANRMTIDKMVEIAYMLNCKVQETQIIVNP